MSKKAPGHRRPASGPSVEATEAAIRAASEPFDPEKPSLSRMDLIRLFMGIPEAFLVGYEAFRNKPYMRNVANIFLEDVAKWLGAAKSALVDTLTHSKSYEEGVDFVVRSGAVPGKRGGHLKKDVYLTFPCFRRLAMQSRAKRAEQVRRYFAALDDFQTEYHGQILEGLRRDIARLARIDLRKRTHDGPGYLYITKGVVADIARHPNVNKPGNTSGLVARLNVYNTGRLEDAQYEYTLRVPFRKEAERCLKYLARQRRLRKRRELYEVDAATLMRLATGCRELSDALTAAPTEEEGARTLLGDDADERFLVCFLTADELADAQRIRKRLARAAELKENKTRAGTEGDRRTSRLSSAGVRRATGGCLVFPE